LKCAAIVKHKFQRSAVTHTPVGRDNDWLRLKINSELKKTLVNSYHSSDDGAIKAVLSLG